MQTISYHLIFILFKELVRVGIKIEISYDSSIKKSTLIPELWMIETASSKIFFVVSL